MAIPLVFLLPLLLPLFAGLRASSVYSEKPAVPDVQSDSFRVLDAGERGFDFGPAIAMLLPKPLYFSVRHDSHFRINDTRELLKSAGVLSEEGRTVYVPHVAPEAGVAALYGSRVPFRIARDRIDAAAGDGGQSKSEKGDNGFGGSRQRKDLKLRPND